MAKHIFHCLDGHTCGNPVRVVKSGSPILSGDNMAEKRQSFLCQFDWIRTGLMFEPRGHDMMSGVILYPPCDRKNDAGILFIETSGCLPMCGHGTIGTVTIALENKLLIPKKNGQLRLETPAGLVIANYLEKDGFIQSVRILNVASFLHSQELDIICPELGALKVDVAYGGNFYAIIEPQKNFADMADFSALDLVRISPKLRNALNDKYKFIHPDDPTINGLSHIQWTGKPIDKSADARNAVFYGDKAIDRSPCGTGTSARMAQLAARGDLKCGDDFIHESIIGSIFKGRVESMTELGKYDAIIPSIEGWAQSTGYNIITIDDRDPYAHGFVVV